MLYIAGSLLGAWILNIFGFGNLVIYGFDKFFGVEMTITGYYFIFAVLGVIKMLLNQFHPIKFKIKED